MKIQMVKIHDFVQIYNILNFHFSPNQHPQNFQFFPYSPPYYHNFQNYPNFSRDAPLPPWNTCPPKYWNSSQYFMQAPSHGINLLQSPGIQSNESRRGSVDANDNVEKEIPLEV